MFNLCPYGKEERINRGVYFICSLLNRHCAFVRFCNTDSCLKMLDSHKLCVVKVNEDNLRKTD